MKFIGEHLTVGYTGKVLIWASFLFILIAAVCYLLSSKENRITYRAWRFYARNFFRLHLISISIVLGILIYITINHYFEYNYVWQHSSKDLSFSYLISSVWAGQEGSFLLWIFFQGAIGMYLLHRTKDWEMPVMTVVSVSQLFLTSMILGVKIFGIKIGNDPFLLLRETPDNILNPFFSNTNYLQFVTDGVGMNPLLLNFWMKLHPPVLFFGYASAVVPYAFAFAALWKERYNEWLKPVIPWISFSALVLGTGLLMGGAWAYEDLTFGGFWSWDPVENASLVPWIIIIASLHFVLNSKKNGQPLGSAFAITLLSYILILYSTFLTRSGLLNNTSVHAFGSTGQTGHLAIFIMIFFIVPLVMLIYHLRKLPKSENGKLFSKEFWMFIGSVLLMVSAFQIIFSTSFPLINKLFRTKFIIAADSISYYDNWQIPFVVIAGIIMATTHFLNYKSNDPKEFFKKILFSFSLSIVFTILLILFSDIEKPAYFILAFAALFIAISSIDILFRFYKNSKNISSIIGHLGFGIFLFGIVLSFAQYKIISKNALPVNMGKRFNDAENMMLTKNEILPIGDYYISYSGIKCKGNKVLYQLDFLKKKDDKFYKIFTVYPSIIVNNVMGNVYVPDTKHFLTKDIFNYLLYAERQDTSAENEFTVIKESVAKVNDTIYNDKIKIILSALKVSAVNGKIDTNNIEVTAKMNVLDHDKHYFTSTVFKLKDGFINYKDGAFQDIDYKIRLERISPKRGSVVLCLYEKKTDMVILKSIVFPYINVVWSGAAVMLMGFILSIINRRKRSSKEKRLE